MEFSRRHVVLLGGTSLLAGASSRLIGVSTARAAAPTARLRAVVTLHADDGGMTLTYDIGEGKEREAWTNPYNSSRQLCVMHRIESFNRLTVEFRPEADGSRDEIVFWYGRTDLFAELGNQGGGPSLKPYTVAIYKGDVLQARITAPDPADGQEPQIDKQMWVTRWRWQSARRPILRTASQLIEASLVPPYRPGHSGVAAPPVLPAYRVLGTGGWTRYFPTAGDHYDIGPVPAWHASYLLTGNARMAQSVLDYAEAGNSLPWCIRDAATDAIWDWRNHPQATFGGDQSRALEPHSCQAFAADFGIQLDAAHAPNGFALAYLMTGDAYHLEAAQMAANWLLGSDPDPKGGLVKEKVDGQQTRGASWALNNLVHAWHCTHHAESFGAKMPDWIQPESYWADRLDYNRADLEAFYLRNAPGLRKIGIFHSATSISNWSTWQESFLCLAAGLAVHYGKEDWRPFFEWKMEGVINRYNGSSGWPRSRPFPRVGGEGYMRAGSWQAAGDWAQLAAAQVEPVVPTRDGNLDQGYDTHYLSFDRGVLALAAQLGVTGAKACYDWLDVQMKSGRYTIIDRWAFAA